MWVFIRLRGVSRVVLWFGAYQSFATGRIGPTNNSVQFNVLMESINVTFATERADPREWHQRPEART